MTPETAQQIEAMLRDGASHREIAATVGVARSTIKRHYPGTGWNYRDAGAFGRMVRDTNARIANR